MTVQLALHVLAASNESKKSGPIGLAVILLLCIACYFLFKSMSRHMRKVREGFPGTEKEPADDAPTAASSTATPSVTTAQQPATPEPPAPGPGSA